MLCALRLRTTYHLSMGSRVHSAQVLEDQKRIILQNTQSPEVENERQRKNRWMSLVTALRQRLKLTGIADEAEESILGPLRDAERAADARAEATEKPIAAPTEEEKKS